MKYAIHIIVIELFMQMSKVQIAFSLVDFYSGHEAPGNTSMRDPVFQKIKLAPIECLHDHWLSF